MNLRELASGGGDFAPFAAALTGVPTAPTDANRVLVVTARSYDGTASRATAASFS